MYGPDLTPIFRFFAIVFLVCLALAAYLIIDKGKKWLGKTTTVETRTKPTIDYRLTTNGKEVDTVFIYKFKK